MQNDLLIQELERIDRKNDSFRFYSVLWGRVLLFTPEEHKKILQWSKDIKDLSLINSAHHAFTLGMFGIYSADFPNVVTNLLYASDIFDTHGDKGGVMACRTMLCSSYRSMGQLDKAHNCVQQALQHVNEVDQSHMYQFFKGVAYYQAAEINVELNNYDNAIEFYTTGIKLVGDYPDLKGRFLNGLGVLNLNQEKWDESISYLEQSLEAIKDGGNNLLLESKIMADIGFYHFKKKDFEKSFFYQEASLKMRVENGLLSPAVTNYLKLAELCFASKRTDDALKYGHLAVENAERLKLNIKLYEAHQILSNVYEDLGDISKAFEHYKKYQHFKDEVHNQEVTRKIEQIKTHHKVESAQHEKEIFRLKNVELKAAMDEITESFRYAKRIQTAILPPTILISETLPGSFVFFKPKDIVSGDFYWMEKVDGKILIAAADCTGHGVPGAMVSMVGNNCLNRTVREFGLIQPATILDQLTVLVENTFVHKDFNYDTKEDDIKDGMDISLCCIDISKKQLEWAGANNPLWIARSGEMIEIIADKQPVGKFDYRKPFTNHKIELQQGDTIYLFTDGYADQFGGPHGKKF
jgi:serine phosphatase RsbU (regulator of sigma subunit)